MPLKPLYGKTPLTELKALPLRPGQVKLEDNRIRQVYALVMEHAKDNRALWESAYRLGMALRDKEGCEQVSAWMNQALENQAEDGELSLPVPEGLRVMRAAWAMYAAKPDRAVLESMMRWCAWLSSHWDDVEKCAEIRVRSGDLMEFLCNLYRVTGRKGLTALCEKLRQLSMDWSGALHTFSVQQGAKKALDRKALEEGMAREAGDEAGFYTRQYLLCHGETLADGARSCLASTVFSGNGAENRAAKDGWEKISRWHGAVCGGVTSDEMLGGLSSACAVDVACLGAWAEAFAMQLAVDEKASWAAGALEKMLENGLSAAMVGNSLLPFQRVNGLAANCGTKDCFHVHEGNAQAMRALTRLSRAWTAVAECAVTQTVNGVRVNLYLPGKYSVKVNGTAMELEIAGNNGEYVLGVQAKEDVQAEIALMVPAWTDDAYIRVNEDGADEGKPGEYLALNRVWRNGDRVQVSFEETLRVAEGYHQGAAVYCGPKLMAYAPADDRWAVALCGAPEKKDGKVVVPVAHVPGWKCTGKVPAELPVRPQTEGEPFEAVLTPYAETPCRLALLPRSAKA